MPQLSEIWSSLSTWPALVVGLTVALVSFLLGRLATRVDDRARMRRLRPSRRNIRAGQRFLRTLATRPRHVVGPPRWALTFNTSLGAYELEQIGPDAVHSLRVDFFDTSTVRQFQLAPTIQLSQLPPGLPLTMAIGAPARVLHYGLAIRWDDSFGADQFERLRVADALHE